MEYGTAIEWMKKQPKYRNSPNKLIKKFEYKGFMCIGVITRTNYDQEMIEHLRIRPMVTTHDIGNGAGQSVNLEFNCKQQNKSNG